MSSFPFLFFSCSQIALLKITETINLKARGWRASWWLCMPGLEDLKGCIATMKNTQNIFDAMKLIVATNVWNAKEVVMNGCPFSKNLMKMPSMSISNYKLKTLTYHWTLLSTLANGFFFLLLLRHSTWCWIFNNQSLNIISHSFWEARLHNSWNLPIIKIIKLSIVAVESNISLFLFANVLPSLLNAPTIDVHS